jgi:hypothetical protein
MSLWPKGPTSSYVGIDAGWRSWNDEDDPILSEQNKGGDKFDPTRKLYMAIIKKHGDDPVSYSQYYGVDEDFDASEGPVEGEQYSKWQLERFADEMLREDVKRELCRKCGSYGSETGSVESMPQADKNGDPITDGEGATLYMDFPELVCEKGHRWYKGEGKSRSIQGKNPILFENHLQDRRRREIYTSIGTPDPSIQRGMYNRTHPQGRKVNSKEQRKKNGASFFR